jgi:signal transduction histidine kinase
VTIKTRQVFGVTLLVGLVVAVLSAVHLVTLARLNLEETTARSELLANAIFQRSREVVPRTADPYQALRRDPGLRSILESSIAYSKNVAYAAVVDPAGTAVAHSFVGLEGRPLPEQEDMRELTERGIVDQLRALYSDQTFEVEQRLLFGDQDFGSIRIGISPLLARRELQDALWQAGQTALGLMLIAMLVATLLSQWLLRPIHMIRAGLSRLERGESDVRLDLPPGDEFRELGTSFEQLSAQISAMRARQPGHQSDVETVVDRLEDAVALFNEQGELLFANPAMRALLPGLEESQRIDVVLPPAHVVTEIVQRTLLTRRTQGPATVTWPAEDAESATERLLVTNPIEDPLRGFTGAMLLVRNLGYLDQVRSTLQYSRKLAALGRLLAGVAHEVKNPLNAMTIHLELLKNKLEHGRAVRRTVSVMQASGTSILAPDAGELRPEPEEHPAKKHVDVIAAEIRRLDQVMQDFLKFVRPGEMKLEPLEIGMLLDDVARVVGPDAERAGITFRVDVAPHTPEVNGDGGMLRQALMNLALNAAQATPAGGTIRMGCRPLSSGRVEVTVDDTGRGIKPEHLDRIFDLYFTTREKGSGIGLSMVYRIVQLHDGDIEVQSTPGSGTRFRILLPPA